MLSYKISRNIFMFVLLFIVSATFARTWDVDPNFLGWSGKPDTVKVYCKGTWTASQKDSAQAAIDRWNDAGCEPALKMTNTESEAKITLEHSSTINGAGTCGVKPSWSQAYTSSTIKCNTTRTIGLTELVTHELGHSLGLNDTDSAKNPNDVMKGAGSNGSHGALSKHDKAEVKAAAKKNVSSTVSFSAPITPVGSCGLGTPCAVMYDLPLIYPPHISAGAIIEITPIYEDPADPPIIFIGASVIDNLLLFEVLFDPSHWSGMDFFDILILFPEPDIYPPVEFTGYVYTNIDPLEEPIEYECSFEHFFEDGLMTVVWNEPGFSTYPFPEQQLRARLDDGSCTHFRKGDGPFVIELDEGSDYTITLIVDDFQGNYASHTLDIVNLGTEQERTSKPDEFNVIVSPNPFNSQVNIRVDPYATIELFDILGNRISDREIAYSKATENGTLVSWKPSADRCSGVYFARISDGARTETCRVVYAK